MTGRRKAQPKSLGGVYERGGLWYIRFTWQRKDYRESSGSPRKGGVHMVDKKFPLENVKGLLRHRSIRSTEVYAEVSPGARAAYSRRVQESPAIVKVGR